MKFSIAFFFFSNPNPYLFGRLGQPSIVDMLYRGKQNGFYIECKNNSHFKLKCNKIIFGHYHVTIFFVK